MSWFDDHEDELVYGWDHKTRCVTFTRCKHCGDERVRWRQQGGRWVLFSLTPGVEHKCPARAPASPDEFPTI